MEPGTVGPSSPRAPGERRQSPPQRSSGVWIGLAVVAVVGVVIVAAASGRDRGAAHDVAIAAEPAAPIVTGAAPMHPPTPLVPPARGAAPATLADASRLVSIEMYSAAWCQACGRAKTWMRDQGITFHEVDVDRRAGALAQLQMLNPRSSLPTFDVDGRVIVGFEEGRLRTAIDEAARATRERP